MGPARHVLPLTLAGVALGILVADSVAIPAIPVGFAGALLVAGGAVMGRRGSVLVLLGVATIAFAAGAWRGAAIAEATAGASVALLADGAEHDLTGTVLDDPRPREDRLQLVLGELQVERGDGPAALSDRLLVWLPRGLDASAGDRLRLRSEVEIAEDFEGFAYREYLERQGIGAVAHARSAEVAADASGPAAILAGLRSALLSGLNGIVPEPEAALGAGILLGVRASIAPEINDAFARAGLTHVVAISGWNIAIVAALVTAVVGPLSRRPGGRWTTAAVAATTVGGYVLLTGASPSVVRAALMAGAMLVAKLGGSRAHAASALALAALVMLLAAPSVLWDVGFQLSLLATAGLVWFGGAVERRLPGWPGWIREPIALTLAAQLTTLPVILVNFERLSLVAPVANVLVVPFVPVAMLFSALAARGGSRGRRAVGADRRPSDDVAGRWCGLALPAADRGAGLGGRLGAAGGRRRPGARSVRGRLAADARARCLGRRPVGRAARDATSPTARLARPGCGQGGAAGADRCLSRRGPARHHDRLATGWPAARHRARHRPGRRDPGRGAERRDHAGRRRSRPGADAAAARREPAVLRPPHRRHGREPPAPGPCRGAGRGARTLRGPDAAPRRHPVREPGLRPPDGRCVRGARPRPRPGPRRRSDCAGSDDVGRDPLPHRCRCRCAAAGRRHQQRIDRAPPAPRRVHRPADRRCGVTRRVIAGHARAGAGGRPAEGRPSRLDLVDDDGASGGDAAHDRGYFGRRGQRVRPSSAGNPCRTLGRRHVPHRPPRRHRGRQRRTDRPGPDR